MSLKRGAFVVFEGVDRCGKTTQCTKLLQALRQNDIKSELFRFPDRTTPSGQLIDRYLCEKKFSMNDQAIHLLFAANRWEVKDKMEELLRNGVTLILDRYSYSGIAYSAAKQDMNYDWCKQAENGLLKPDVVFLLSAGANLLAQRSGFGEERYEHAEIQKKVAQTMEDFSRSEDNWQVIDAGGSLEDIHNLIYSKVLNVISECGSRPLTYLQFK